jgi:hypothetical protein
VHEAENDVHRHLIQMIDKHRIDHEVHHVARDIASWSGEHIRRLSDEAGRRGMQLSQDPAQPNGAVRQLKEAASTLIGRRPEPGVLLLADMQHLYLLASAASLAWEALAQLAQAQRDSPALQLATECHPQTLRQIRWANTMIKIQSPQILSSL